MKLTLIDFDIGDEVAKHRCFSISLSGHASPAKTSNPQPSETSSVGGAKG